jgi:hypothetical protein
MNIGLHNSIFRTIPLVAVACAVACSASATNPGAAISESASAEQASIAKPTSSALSPRAHRSAAKLAAKRAPSPRNAERNGSSDADGGGAPPGGPLECGTKTADDCFACCDEAFPGVNDMLNEVFDTCICRDPGSCAVACAASYCAEERLDTDDECNACLDEVAGSEGGACSTVTDDACWKDAACTAVQACYSTCPMPPMPTN